MGCQILAAAFLCNLLYQIKNLWQSGVLPNLKWSAQNKFNKLYNLVSFQWLLFLIQQEPEDWWRLNSFHWIPAYCPTLFNNTSPTLPTHLQCFQSQENADQNIMGVLWQKGSPLCAGWETWHTKFVMHSSISNLLSISAENWFILFNTVFFRCVWPYCLFFSNNLWQLPKELKISHKRLSQWLCENEPFDMSCKSHGFLWSVQNIYPQNSIQRDRGPRRDIWWA